MNELPPIMTLADTATYLHCSRQHVYDMINAGRLKAYKVDGHRYVDMRSLARLFH